MLRLEIELVEILRVLEVSDLADSVIVCSLNDPIMEMNLVAKTSLVSLHTHLACRTIYTIEFQYRLGVRIGHSWPLRHAKLLTEGCLVSLSELGRGS